MKKYWYWDEKGVSAQLTKLFKKGGIVAGTSDTVIGLLAPLTEEGKTKLDRIKKRMDKPYLVLVSDIHQAAQLSATIMSASLQPLLKACWPGPLTVIVSANAHVPDYMNSATGAIAIRVPNHQGLQTLLQSVDGLFSTSANVTGEKVPESLEQLTPEIMDNVDMIINDRLPKINKPSTILDCTGSVVKLVREGAYPQSWVQKYLLMGKI